MLNFPRPASYKSTDAVVQSDKQPRSLVQFQESIYSFLLANVKQHSAETVLQQFIDLFIFPPKITNSDHLQAIQEIITSNNKEEFHNTIKRCCYILLNNWKITKKRNI